MDTRGGWRVGSGGYGGYYGKHDRPPEKVERHCVGLSGLDSVTLNSEQTRGGVITM